MNLCPGCYAEDMRLYGLTLPTGRTPPQMTIQVCAHCLGTFVNMQREAVMQCLQQEQRQELLPPLRTDGER